MTFTATKRPLFGNGEPLAITATTSATAQTIFVAGGVTRGWDEASIYITNTSNGSRTLHYDIGATGTFAQVTIPGNTSMYRLLPSGREAMVFRGGLVINVYSTGGTGLQALGVVVEVREDA